MLLTGDRGEEEVRLLCNFVMVKKRFKLIIYKELQSEETL